MEAAAVMQGQPQPEEMPLLKEKPGVLVGMIALAIMLARDVRCVVLWLLTLPSLDERAPRLTSGVYFRHRLRALVTSGQAGWLFAFAAFLWSCQLWFNFWLAFRDSIGSLAVTAFLIAAGAVAGLGVAALWQAVAARLIPFLFAHPQSQAAISKGYRLPPIPEPTDTPFAVLGEVHITRSYAAGGSYVREYTTSADFSATPEWSVLPALSLVTGLLVLGGVGSGKTSYVLKPAIFPFFNHHTRPGGLVLDSKGALVVPLAEVLNQGDRLPDLLVIGPRHLVKWNPLHQPTASADLLANDMMQAIENVRGKPYGSDAMWIRDGARQTLEALIGLLRLVSGQVTAATISASLGALTLAAQGSDTPAAVAIDWVNGLTDGLDFDDTQARYVSQYRSMLAKIFSQDEKFRNIYTGEIETIVAPLIDVAVIDKYNSAADDINMPSWLEIINAGRIVVLDCNQTEYPTLSIVLGTMLKIGYQNAMLSRLEHAKMGAVCMDKYMALCIDEYQQYCSIKDTEYLAQCRESKSLTVFLTQSYESISKRMDEANTKTIFNSLRNKLILNQSSTEGIQKFFGTVERSKTSTNINEHIADASMNSGGKFSGKSTVAQSISVSTSREDAVPDEVFRSLPVGQGILTMHDGQNTYPPHRVFLRAFWKPESRYADLHKTIN
jgi:hypothetical protein